MSTEKKRNRVLIPIAAAWLLITASGLWLMFDHEFGAASFAETPATWPESLNAFSRHEKPLTLVLSVHPECPCTGASLEQLERLLARNPDQIEVIGIIEDYESSENFYKEKLQSLPNAIAVPDKQGALASELGNLVSGAVLAYDQQGNLRFRGGLTASRGHAGSSKGMELLESLARNENPLELCESPVFGCPLTNPQSI